MIYEHPVDPKARRSGSNWKNREHGKELPAIVRALSACGVTCEAIASYCELSMQTLLRDFKRDLELGRIESAKKVHDFILKTATGEVLNEENTKAQYSDCVRAAIWYSKARMGWKERNEVSVNLSGDIGIKKLTDEELERVIIEQVASIDAK